MGRPKNTHVVNMAGARVGRWVVVRYAGPGEDGRGANWLCRCKCGTEGIVLGTSLRRGKSHSCGCLQRETAAKTVLGHSIRHGYSAFPEYAAYRGMLHRCL